ncbi:restriction endonuclease [Halovenus salina]|uniref:Restriction endonuclease n=1 Tax=Halovenus salina TaxID=1510225 RepID=A0ABD5W441_9EURY
MRNKENVETFRDEYAQMAIHEKAMENTPLVGAVVVATLLLLGGILIVSGVI